MPKFSAKITERDPTDIPKSSAISRNINRRSNAPRNSTHQFFSSATWKGGRKDCGLPTVPNNFKTLVPLKCC